MTAAITFDHVTKKYLSLSGETTAVEEFDCSIQEGEFVGIVGPSGCGKSTLLSMLAGLFGPSSGEVRLFGEPVTEPSLTIGYMLQQDYLLPWRTILDNVCIGLEIQSRKNAESIEYAKQLLREMGLEGTEPKYPHQLSGGMRQRAALVRTLAVRPKILLLDEPFSALDYQIKLQLEDLIVQTLDKYKITAVLVTHDLGEAIAMCDRVLVMSTRPGRLKNVFEVPEDIRALSPLDAREHQSFHQLFRQLWEELQDEE
ncbi:ABC transporter ATP-binding protein [Effusibacillus lacus]|uniref:Spermidine/putrescine ABC transporter ATP-binding protein n=1 Tax=Effusibacillus lacus TaxID=1348429 RepID=A0A292YQD6_9BACL|nr:ABC transporter ATP-binding protein [Effusibacillus lacus]TCS70041.1 NitT/TauT family transport system ATP-binding protein [Effusibacillus lacus]GAX91119.1 spermidine/putrescine ABC transporter ATP-binding protein [Effusibacillus lacus]